MAYGGAASTKYEVRELTLSPTVRFSFSLISLALTASVGAVYWPGLIGLAATVIALLFLLPLTLVFALDAVRYLKSRSPTTGTIAIRITLSVPVVILAVLALLIGILCVLVLCTKWSSKSPQVLVGSLIFGVIFFRFGIKLLQVLLFRKHDKTIP